MSGGRRLVTMKDVISLCHPKPREDWQATAFKKILDGTLEAPDTWEVNLSAGKDKRETFERLIAEQKLGALALLRNLRNMQQAGVPDAVIRSALKECKADFVLPFRFISAAKYAPKFEPELEALMLRCLAQQPKLAGKTVLVVDISGSMSGVLSGKSEITRMESAMALAMLARELCDEVAIYATAGSDARRIHATELVPPRRGFGLKDAILGLYSKLGGGGIFLKQVMDYTLAQEKHADRVIVFTDEQDCDLVNKPTSAKTWADKHYLVNIASYRNGIGYGAWTHIDGFSEAVLSYIQAAESTPSQ